MNTSLSIRPATAADAEALLAIYRPYVENTTVSFELEVPGVAEFAARIEKAISAWAWLLAELEGRPLGYAYGSAHRPRPAYAWSVETSVYIHSDYQRRGIARALYRALLTALAAKEFASAYAGIALPNEASVGFHHSMGFGMIGVFPKVGRKFDRWHDVAWMYRPLTGSGKDDG